MDAENSNLQTDIQNLQEIRSGLLERCKLAKLQHARQIDLIELSVDDAGKLQMDVEELTILVAKKQTVVDERESIRINSKECGTQVQYVLDNPLCNFFNLGSEHWKDQKL